MNQLVLNKSKKFAFNFSCTKTPTHTLNIVLDNQILTLTESTNFSDGTIIIFTHSNLIDLNKNIHKIFTVLNKWLRTNQLYLNFNKNNYVHFTTKRNMSVNLIIGFNNNFITNSSYTKFLGVTMYTNISRHNHIYLITKKLITASYIITNEKTFISALPLKVVHCAYFTRLCAMELYFGETRRIVP